MSMRRYHIEIDGRRFEVDVQDVEGQRFRVRAQGREFDVALTAQEELTLTQIAPQMLPGGAPPGTPRPATGGGRAGPGTGAVPTPSAAPGSGPAPRAATASQAEAAVLRSPMPGVILRLSVAAGAHVQRGQDIAVLEAMKMENIVRSPHAGVIAELCVEAGQQVAHGQPIVRYAAAAAPGGA
jgi:biotin carboxyl carrier protein